MRRDYRPQRKLLRLLHLRQQYGLLVTGAIWVPASAARTDESGEAFVWVVDATSMKVQRRPVTLGQLSGSQVEVGSGLQRGELIATSGVHHLREGMQVRRFEK